MTDCPLLADPRALERFYNIDTLNNEQARTAWVARTARRFRRRP